MEGECEEPSGTPPPPCVELGLALTTTATPIDATGDICAAFSGLRLLEGNEVEPLKGGEMMLSSEGVEVEGADRERGEGGAGGGEKSEEIRVENGGGDNEREDDEGKAKGEEVMMMDSDGSGNVNNESNGGDSEKERGEEDQRTDASSEEEEFEGKVEVKFADNEKKKETVEKEEELDCKEEKKEGEGEQTAPKVKLTVPYPQRPFTPDCLTYLKSGYCAFGMSCCFNHPPLRKSGNVPLNGGCREKERLVGGGKVMNAQLYPQREGKEDCAFYMKRGRCNYGLKCCFNHPPRNPNPVTGNREDQTALDDRNGPREAYMNWGAGPSTSHIRRRPDCARYVKEGRCDYGAECRFFHHRNRHPYEFNWNPGRDWQEEHELETNFLGLPLRPGKDDCPEYMTHGACQLSTGCQYNHPNPDPVIDKQDTHRESDKYDTLPSLEEQAPEGHKPSLARIKQMLLPPERPDGSDEGYKEIEAQRLSSSSLEGFRDTYKVEVTTTRSNDLGNGCEPVEYPARPGEPLCPAYIKFGACKLKSECWYDHPKDPAKPAVESESYNGWSSTMDGITSDEENIYPQRPGEPECLFYMNHGHCRFRSTCIFHHPRHLQNKGANYSSCAQASRATPGNYYEESKYPERRGEPECAYFMMHGDCKFQSNCKFHHPKDRNEKTAPYSSFAHASKMASKNCYEGSKYPERPGERECAYYMMHGDCKFQSNCKFHHPKDWNEKKTSQGGVTKFVPKKFQNQFASLEIT